MQELKTAKDLQAQYDRVRNSHGAMGWKWAVPLFERIDAAETALAAANATIERLSAELNRGMDDSRPAARKAAQ